MTIIVAFVEFYTVPVACRDNVGGRAREREVILWLPMRWRLLFAKGLGG